MQALVIRNYRAQYPDPLVLAKGDKIVLGERDSEYPAFIWATNRQGKSGWVPVNVLDRSIDEAYALQAYSACELDADLGEVVDLVYETGGWWWAQNKLGKCGWLPASALEIDKGMV